MRERRGFFLGPAFEQLPHNRAQAQPLFTLVADRVRFSVLGIYSSLVVCASRVRTRDRKLDGTGLSLAR